MVRGGEWNGWGRYDTSAAQVTHAPRARNSRDPPMAETFTLHRGRHLSLKVIDRGGDRPWEYAHRPGVRAVVAVVAEVEVDGEPHLLGIEQDRPPVGTRVLELPAGLVGDGDDADEDPALAAARELEEETGYRAEHWERLTAGPTSAGMSDEVVTFYRARGLTPAGDGGGVDGERIENLLVPLAGADAFLAGREAAGVMVDPKVWAGLYFLGRTS